MELILNKQNYDDFLSTRFISGIFLQSSFWRDFLKKQNLNTWQLAVVDKQETIATALVYENKLPLGRSYFYSPKGPVLSENITIEQKKKAVSLILSKVRDLTIETKKYQEIFFKLEPNSHDCVLRELVKSHDVQPRDNWILDLHQNVQEILATMHAKTRYNIALARKKGVQISFSSNLEDIKSFFVLAQKTAKKNNIRIHSENYYIKLWQTVLEHRCGQLCLASLDNKIVAVNLIIRFGGAVTYLHGASDYSYHQSMAPYLLQWETIKQSIDLGYKIYDFGGVSPDDGSKKSWQGITRFKQGFGGRVIGSPGAYNFIYDKNWYNLYLITNKIIRVARCLKK